MSSRSDLTTTWQDHVRYLENEDGETFESAASGTEYESSQLVDRLKSEVDMMVDGENPSANGNTRPVPRIADSEGNYVLRDVVDQEWYDLIAGDGYEDAEQFVPFESTHGDTFVQYSPEESSPSPHQGWKVRVASYADEARDVAEAVLPYLQEHDISHKVMQDVQIFNNNEGTRQEGKFITIYPEIDEDRQDVVMENGMQLFKREDPGWNSFSINSNTKNARQIVEDLEDELEGSVAGLEGRTIDGKNGEEKQYGNTRIHFRYAHHFNTPAVIIDESGGLEQVGDHEGLVNKDGELVEGSYIGDQVDEATRPDRFLEL
ncbi:hypothetical protein GKQ38_05460 [Candidatus Nanohaloarchaea archaeon]|nr:hypothetical protein GKQ38_05460 [Candidatus Nanohaloarchaea archaeon]